MGQDKAGTRLNEKTLLQHVTAVVQPLFEEVSVSTRKLRTDCILPQLLDHPAHCGPLAGLAAGLTQAKSPWLFVVACDMPFITQNLIEQLASCRKGVEAVVPLYAGHPQPLAAFYATSCLPALEAILNGGEKKSLRALLEKLTVRYVNETELDRADLLSFYDLDTPEELAAYEGTVSGFPLSDGLRPSR